MAADHTIPELDRSGLRSFAFTTGGIVAGLFGLFFPWLLENDWPLWPWIVFGVLGTLGLIAPTLLKPLYHGWMKFGLLASKVTTPLILGIVFFLVITPIGIVKKIIRSDSLSRVFKADAPTYRIKVAKKPARNLERPF